MSLAGLDRDRAVVGVLAGFGEGHDRTEHTRWREGPGLDPPVPRALPEPAHPRDNGVAIAADRDLREIPVVVRFRKRQ